jgi:hemerythrin superfamily protein
VTTPAPDIIQLLLDDHRKIAAMIASLDGTAPEEVPERFWSFTNALVRHESAEELVVYPALRKVPGGAAIADDRIHEQAEIEQALRNMEKMDAQSVEFADAFAVVATAVLKHAVAEESDTFRLLHGARSRSERIELGRRYEEAKAVAPTHPHPMAPDTPPGNTILGPIVGLIDRIRDVVHDHAVGE